MTLTRANTEFLTIAQVGPLLTAAGADGTTVDGTNADLNGPIGRAVRDLGHSVASAVLVSDTDVAEVTDAQTDEFLDTTALHTMMAVLGNLDDVDWTTSSRSEKASQLAAQIEKKVERLRKAMERDYGYGLAEMETDYLTYPFAEHDE